jgi:hypothetical protein
MELTGSATRLRQGYGVPSIEHVAIGNRAGRRGYDLAVRFTESLQERKYCVDLYRGGKCRTPAALRERE